MANLVITKTAFTAKIEFNDYSTHQNIKRLSFRRDEISEVIEHEGDNHITMVLLDGDSFELTMGTEATAMKIDTVDGNTPADNNELFDELEVLQQV